MEHGDPPAIGLTARFALVIAAVYAVLDAYAVRDWTATAFVGQIRQLLDRRLVRFTALVARFHAGTLPVARPEPEAVAPAVPKGGASERLWDPMPRNRAWLWHLDPTASTYLRLFDELLADPKLPALLAATPQAGRLLRPLWFMVSPHPLPKVLRAPLLRRSPRAAATAIPALGGERPDAAWPGSCGVGELRAGVAASRPRYRSRPIFRE